MVVEQETATPQVKPKDLERPEDDQFGVIESWIQLGVGMGETVTKAVFGIAQDIRNETKNRVDATLGWSEEMLRGGYRFARQIAQRTDDVVGDALARGEYGTLTTLRAIRRTGHDVASFSSTTFSSAVGGTGQSRRMSRASAAA